MVGGAEIPQTRTSSGGNHPNREGEERGIHRSRINFKGFNDNHECNQPLKQVWRHDDMMSSNEDEGEETMDEYNRGPMRGDRCRTMVGQNVNPHRYGKRKSYQVKAEIPNFVGNLDIEVVLDWLYEVDKFFEIMEVPEEEQVKVVSYKLRGGVRAWWQREQDNRRAQVKRLSFVHQEIQKIVKDEIFPIVNQVDARLQNFKIQFLKEATKFVRDFKSLAKEADESLAKHKALELEIKRLLGAIVSQDIMSIVQSNYVIDTSNLQSELDRMKERFENCIIKKENEYAKLWNDWYKKWEECKYDKILYDKAYNDM
ncbi:hypothetical protein Tco_1057089 [Tanacetum coccineum]|uniref:Retrotransposon gag domain-containing protein n=1 Tax=Tanacetum coccineum TaxID=301880 RepID=A0ABQ5H684_9ASTR